MGRDDETIMTGRKNIEGDGRGRERRKLGEENEEGEVRDGGRGEGKERCMLVTEGKKDTWYRDQVK